MATYVMLNSFTEQGTKTVKDLPARVKAGKQAFQAVGAKVKDFYAVMGLASADAIVIFEAPDDETAAKAAMTTGAMGFVRTQTVRAFTEQEVQKITTSLG
jgi:uncharacterized protein with GYD domain